METGLDNADAPEQEPVRRKAAQPGPGASNTGGRGFRRVRVRPSPQWRRHVPRVFATLMGVTAALCGLSAVGGAFWAGFRPVRDAIDATLLPAPQNLGYAVFLGILAAAVARRKRIAWRILVTYLALEVLLYVPAVWLLTQPGVIPADEPLTWYDNVLFVLGAVVAVVALTVLVLARRQFYAKVQRASVRRAIGTLLGLLAVSALIGWGLVHLAPGSVTRGSRWVYALSHVLGGIFNVQPGRGNEAPGWVDLLLGLFGAISMVAAVAVLFRSQRAAAVLAPDAEQRIRDLLAQHGERDSLGYFATRRDKLVVFSPSGKAAVTYRPVAGVSLASGDPLGDPEAWGQAIGVWLQVSSEFGWTPAVMGASEDGATAYRRAGLHVLELGDEAILSVRDFTLEGRHMRTVRQAVRRVERAGYTCRVRRHAEISTSEFAHIAALTDRWRDTEVERGFSMALGRLGDPADGQCVLVEALDPQGCEAAVLSFAPWGASGASLELMRRDREADNGLMEFMVATLIAQAPRLGIERVSLNFAMFRSAFEQGARIGAGPILRAWRSTLLFLSRWWQIESLYRSNAKYQPRWTPRYLCFRDRRELVRVGVASAIAEGFLRGPDLSTLFRRGRAEARGPEPARAAGREQGDPSATPVRVGSSGELVLAEPAVLLPIPGATEQVQVRLRKLADLRAEGIDPYPVGFPRTDLCGAIRDRHQTLAPGTPTGDRVAVAGRVVLLRDHGHLCFAKLRDSTGDLQIMLSAEATGQTELGRWKANVDLGDHVGVTGEVVTSRHGELSILADSWTMTAKCLHPLPDKHRGLVDPEARVRQRYLDLVVNAEAREVLRARSAAVRSLRESLADRGYLEVETPILQRIHGGANAKPFQTHINAYNLPLYLRIAPELYLKRLLVGGVEKVFELGRTFRNEGVSVKHNPEFTILEAYQAYADYLVMLDLTRTLIQEAATAVYGSPKIRHGDQEYDISGTWPVKTVNEAVSQALGEEVTADSPLDDLRRLAEQAGVPQDPAWGRGALLLELYERLVEARTLVPTFYTDFPTDVSPLTRQHRDDSRLAERWDLVAFGTELGTAYSELVDPVEQRRRLTEQSLLAAGGDLEAMQLDEDFLHALEYAMPPSGGLGIGVDRVVMLLTGRTIRETLAFPLTRASD